MFSGEAQHPDAAVLGQRSDASVPGGKQRSLAYANKVMRTDYRIATTNTVMKSYPFKIKGWAGDRAPEGFREASTHHRYLAKIRT